MIKFSMLFSVVNHEQGSKALRIAKKHGVKGGTICLARGTVHNKLLELLDLNDIRKEAVIMVTEREQAENAMENLSREMAFHKPGHGIVFSVRLDNFIGTRHGVYYTGEEKESVNTMYSAIFTVVEKGLAEDAVEAARAAGATGGTIINARGSSIHETGMLFAMPIEPEKEIVMILCPQENTEAIATSIRELLHIDEAGKGVLFVMQVDEVHGLHNKE